jgi:2-oxoglutarate ferredoxin oxidoreductase subunit gamma
MIQVRFAGLGGQGIILMGEILGEAAVIDKKYVGQTSSYGSEARGSACKADVVISDSWIDYPEADVLACMSPGTYRQNLEKVNPSRGIVFIESQLIKPDPSSRLKHLLIPSMEKALKELGNQMVANIILLGAVVKTVGLVNEESLLQALSNRVPRAHLELNKKALALGFELANSSPSPAIAPL